MGPTGSSKAGAGGVACVTALDQSIFEAKVAVCCSGLLVACKLESGYEKTTSVRCDPALFPLLLAMVSAGSAAAGDVPWPRDFDSQTTKP